MHIEHLAINTHFQIISNGTGEKISLELDVWTDAHSRINSWRISISEEAKLSWRTALASNVLEINSITFLLHFQTRASLQFSLYLLPTPSCLLYRCSKCKPSLMSKVFNWKIQVRVIILISKKVKYASIQ